MHVLPADIYVLTCSSLALSLGILALEYYDFSGQATLFVGTAVSSISIILRSSTLLYHYISRENCGEGRDSLATSLPFILVTWAMAYLWTCALAATTMANLLGASAPACGGHCWLSVQEVEFVLILCEIANTLLVAIRSIQERRRKPHRYLYLHLPCPCCEITSMTPNKTG